MPADTTVESPAQVFVGGTNPLPEPIPGNSLVGRLWNLMIEDADNPVKSGRVFVGSISFQGYASADHHCALRDGWGNMIFETYGNVDLSPVGVSFSEPISVFELTVAGLDSGRVVVEVQ